MAPEPRRDAILRAFAPLRADSSLVSSKMENLHRNLPCALRQVPQELFGFGRNHGELGSGGFAEQSCGLRVYLEAFGTVVGNDPVAYFIISYGRGVDDGADLLDALVEAEALVEPGAVEEQHQDRAVERVGGVDGEPLDALQGLGLLYHHQLPFRHHGEAPGCRDDLLHGHVGPVADGLVEVFFVVLQAVLNDCPAYLLGVEGLFSHEQIHRLEDAFPDLFDDSGALRRHVRSAFRHWISVCIEKLF